jgi:membrane protein implicated in regulation of membrane protease activity
MESFTFSALFWLILGVALMLIEMALPGFVIFFFGVGALVVSGAVLLGLEDVNIQMLIFIFVSLLTLIIFRKKGKKYFEGKVSGRNQTDESIENIIGQKARTITDIIPGEINGKVEFHGTNWNAVSDEKIEKDSVCVILSRDNLTLKVKKI